jgi:hypothetical protein
MIYGVKCWRGSLLHFGLSLLRSRTVILHFVFIHIFKDMSVEEISRLLACTPADKEERVLSFIESQKRFYPFRVSQGPAGHPAQLSILSTNPRRVTLEAPSSKNVLVSGFATPVLKPRASNFHQDSSVSTSADHNSNSGHQKKAHTAQAKKKQNSGHGLKPSETKRVRRDCTLKNSVEHRGAVKGVNISNKVSALPVKSSKGIQLESKAVQDDEIVASKTSLSQSITSPMLSASQGSQSAEKGDGKGERL